MKKLLFILWVVLSFSQVSLAQEAKGAELDNDTTIYSSFFVDTPAQYSAGDVALMQFLAKNVKYPIEALKAGIEGTVRVQFVIEKDGTITHIKVKKGVSPELDAESIRVVSLMPNWEPGKKNGKIVRSKNEIPVIFKKAN